MERVQKGKSLTVSMLERKLTKSKQITEGDSDSKSATEAKDVDVKVSIFSSLRHVGTTLTRLLQNDSWGGTDKKEPETSDSRQDQKLQSTVDFSDWYHKDFMRDAHLCVEHATGKSTSEIVRNTCLTFSCS